MSLWKSGPSKIAFGFGLGIMTAEVFKELIPVFRELRRPLLKAAVQSGEILARNGRIPKRWLTSARRFRHGRRQLRSRLSMSRLPVKKNTVQE